MSGHEARHRYRMVNVRTGYVIVEKEVFSGRARSYFSAEPVPPKEEYREGSQIWKFGGMAQSFQFDVRDETTGQTLEFRELLGLTYYGCSKPGSDLHTIGDIAHDEGVSIYVAVAYEAADGGRLEIPREKIAALNGLFNERVRSHGKKILILPDCFGLYSEISHGQIMIDFGLTSMEDEHA